MNTLSKWSSKTSCNSVVIQIVSASLSILFLLLYWHDYHAVTPLQRMYPSVTLKDKWILLENNVSLFSAFYDNRAFRSRPVLVVLGLEKQSDRTTRYKCILAYRNGTKVTLRETSPLQILTRVHWVSGVDKEGRKILNYRPFAITCVLSYTLEIPELVTIVSHRQSGGNSKSYLENTSINSQKFAMVTNRKAISLRKSFGVCISSPIFEIHNPQQFIDTFEMNRLLGAEFFTVYVYRVAWKAWKILERYSRDGLAEVIDNWGEKFPGKAHYYGQLLSVSDCLYRNIYRVKYLVYTDLDEVIMPLNHPNFASLINEFDTPATGSFNFEMVYLRAVENPRVQRVNCPSGTVVNFQSPRFVTFKNRSHAVGFISGKTKYITKTSVSLIAQIHYVEKLVSGYLKIDVPVENGLLYHYRVPYQTSGRIKAWVMDTAMERYLIRLSKAIQYVLCGLP